jgi:hypothetical protein
MSTKSYKRLSGETKTVTSIADQRGSVSVSLEHACSHHTRAVIITDFQSFTDSAGFSLGPRFRIVLPHTLVRDAQERIHILLHSTEKENKVGLSRDMHESFDPSIIPIHIHGQEGLLQNIPEADGECRKVVHLLHLAMLDRAVDLLGLVPLGKRPIQAGEVPPVESAQRNRDGKAGDADGVRVLVRGTPTCREDIGAANISQL